MRRLRIRFYTTASLAKPAASATSLIQNIATRPLPAVNWEIAYLVLTAFGRLQQIAEGWISSGCC